MRIVLITQGVSRIVEPLFLSRHEIVGVIESAPRNYSKKVARYRFLGAIQNQISKILKGWINLQTWCLNNEIPYYFLSKNSFDNLKEWVQKRSPDLIVVYSMSQLLAEDTFKIPKHGAINLHPSYLPDYRGPNPDFWQYYDMVTNPGVTVHYVDKGEDTGDIIFQERIEIPLGTKSTDRLDILIGAIGLKLIFQALDAIELENVVRIKQLTFSKTARARNIAESEHEKIIDWASWDGVRIWNVLRGTETWLKALPDPSCWNKFKRWSVGDLNNSDEQSMSEVGKVKKINGRNCVVVNNGYVCLDVVYDWRKGLKWIMRI